MKTVVYIPTDEEKVRILASIDKAIAALSDLPTVEQKAWALAVLCQQFENMTGINPMEVKAHGE